jgi:hypothetical protein
VSAPLTVGSVVGNGCVGTEVEFLTNAVSYWTRLWS